jgi:hypothetical protein
LRKKILSKYLRGGESSRIPEMSNKLTCFATWEVKSQKEDHCVSKDDIGVSIVDHNLAFSLKFARESNYGIHDITKVSRG